MIAPFMVSDGREYSRNAAWALAMLPCLVAFNLPPSPTLLNQCLAIALWGGCLAAATDVGRRAASRPGMPWAFVAALLALCSAAAWAMVAGSLPFGIGMVASALIAAAVVVVLAAARLSMTGGGQLSVRWGVRGLIAAASASAVVGALQVLAPEWIDGHWIATSTFPGRAVGNLRQPNHLSTLLMWGLIAVVAAHDMARLRSPAALAFGLLLLFALVLTGSRTGLLGIGIFVVWGALDRRLSRGSRVALVASPLVYAVLWLGMSTLGHAGSHPFGAESRMTFGNGDVSSSRFAIWSNTLSMIAHEPWTGVGFGEFNIAWTLTAFPHRPTAFFDHSHNLPLQLLVELGVPLGLLVIGLLLAALVQAGRRAWSCSGDEGVARRAAFMMVLMIGLHSMLEYPLWYAYFLLPTACAWGFALSPSALPTPSGDAAPPRILAGRAYGTTGHRALGFAGLVMIVGAAAAVLDYRQVAVIYDPPDNAAPLEDRIARGQRSPLFGHHADYAAATAFGPPKAPLSPSQELAFKRAPHQLLDVRLMIAWSQALAAQGDVDKARWLAARIREFRNPGADEYFAPCQDPAQAAQAFQCQAPTRVVHWREFVQR
jgi:O-antigen ligase